MRPHSFRPTFARYIQRFYSPSMSSRHNTHGLSVGELLERAAADANLAMLRTHVEPSRFQISVIDWTTSLLNSELEYLPLDDYPTRAEVLAQLDVNRSILSPIRRLPVELLSYIFSLVVNGYPLRTLNVAVTLSRICAYWRKTARGHAALWTTVVVETPNNFDEYCEMFLPLTGNMPLDLRCDKREILGDLWDRIAPYASRWRRITLEGRLSKLPDLKVLYMENLQRLVIDAYDAPLSAELSALDFVVAPRLLHVALTLDALQNERQLHMPLTRSLTSLELTTMAPFPVTHALPLLKSCADTLQLLSLKVCYPLEGPRGSYPTSASDTFLLSNLTSLSLVDPACALLNHITAPRIRELILGNVPAYGTQSLMGFLTRSRASRYLRDLRIYSVQERDVHAWIPCLQLMDNLMTLHFDDLLSTRQFLECMVHRADRPLLLPSLRGIALFRVNREHEELHELIDDMCASRAKLKLLPGGLKGYRTIRWIKEKAGGFFWL
ncbi:hypothetical protein EV715DRAFT_211271 [Schizophyllum commune]